MLSYHVEDGAGIYLGRLTVYSAPPVAVGRKRCTVYHVEDGAMVWESVAYGIPGVSAVTSDATASYSIITRVSADAVASYAIGAAVAADFAASYNILNTDAVQSDCTASYAIRAAVIADCVATYSISTGSMPTAAEIAARVRVELASELAYIMDLAKIHALVLGTSLAVTPSSRVAGSVVQTISGDGVTNTTISRSP